MSTLFELYVRLFGLAFIGFILGRKLPATVPKRLGQLLFWIGVPISIVAFLRKTDLSGQIWIAPGIAFSAIFFGAFLCWLVIFFKKSLTHTVLHKSTQGSLLLAAMVGNTGYLGYPVILSVVGTQYFAWALFYDLLGTTLGAYGFGVALAARYGDIVSNPVGKTDTITNSNVRSIHNHWNVVKAILINPALWSFGLGLLVRQITLPPLVVSCLDVFAWGAIAASLILIGMRLSKLSSWGSLKLASVSLAIKMIIVPIILGVSLSSFGLTGKTAQVLVLQMGMPPAFATLVLAETFNLDRELAVTALAVGSMILLITLPIWLWFFR
ncbi:MAG: AEC family transporter [Calothrix sp. C42_A2020_038]|nr:AEC family transporter [Calothrix sp. C42_A2020_038]